jgi:hypothetical protein
LESEDTALCALTDFTQHDPITIEIDSPIEDALAEMSKWGTDALLLRSLTGNDAYAMLRGTGLTHLMSWNRAAMT